MPLVGGHARAGVARRVARDEAAAHVEDAAPRVDGAAVRAGVPAARVGGGAARDEAAVHREAPGTGACADRAHQHACAPLRVDETAQHGAVVHDEFAEGEDADGSLGPLLHVAQFGACIEREASGLDVDEAVALRSGGLVAVHGKVRERDIRRCVGQYEKGARGIARCAQEDIGLAGRTRERNALGEVRREGARVEDVVFHIHRRTVGGLVEFAPESVKRGRGLKTARQGHACKSEDPGDCKVVRRSFHVHLFFVSLSNRVVLIRPSPAGSGRKAGRTQFRASASTFQSLEHRDEEKTRIPLRFHQNARLYNTMAPRSLSIVRAWVSSVASKSVWP